MKKWKKAVLWFCPIIPLAVLYYFAQLQINYVLFIIAISLFALWIVTSCIALVIKSSKCVDGKFAKVFVPLFCIVALVVICSSVAEFTLHFFRTDLQNQKHEAYVQFREEDDATIREQKWKDYQKLQLEVYEMSNYIFICLLISRISLLMVVIVSELLNRNKALIEEKRGKGCLAENVKI